MNRVPGWPSGMTCGAIDDVREGRGLPPLDEGDNIHAVLRRVTKAQPEIFLSGHEGYYRHADIAALIRAVGDAMNPNTEDTGEWTTDPTKP